jgi:hypothetical protein
MFSCSSFKVSSLMLRSLICFVLILYWVRESLLLVDIQFSQHHSLKVLCFLMYVFGTFVKSHVAHCLGLFLYLPLYSIGLCVCFCASTVLFLLLELCSIV